MQRKILVTSALGNIFDAYDASLYAVFSTLFASLFFPATHSYVSLILSLSAFSSTYLARPLGAILFGYLGDRFGRKRALAICMSLMSVPTFIIGILPTFESIGLAAPVTLFLCRLLQGLCSGGELNGAIIFCLEHTPSQQRGIVAGIIASTGILGMLLAMGCGAITFLPAAPVWSWRLLFIFGAMICFCGALLRTTLWETPAFKEIEARSLTKSFPLLAVLRHHFRAFLFVFLKGGLLSTLSYFLIAYVVIFLQDYQNFSLIKATLVSFIGLLFFMIFALVGGRLFDLWPTSTPLKITSFAVAVLILPLIHGLLHSHFLIIVLASAALGMLSGLMAGTGYPFIENLFPPNIRYTGIAVSFTLGTALLGGISPMVFVWVTKVYASPLLPGVGILVLAVLFLASFSLLSND